MADFRFHVDFVDVCEDVDVPEDITAANFAIFADGDCLTRNRPRRPLRSPPSDTVFGPIAGLVDWLIENWGPVLWEVQTPFRKSRLGGLPGAKPPIPGTREAAERWQGYLDESSDITELADWQHRHQLGHACSDLAVPSIVIVPEDRHVVLAVDRLPIQNGASVDFLSSDNTERPPSVFVFRKTDFQAEARALIEKTLDRAHAVEMCAPWAAWLRDRWRDAQAQEESPSRRLGWMLGKVSADRVMELRQERPAVADGLVQFLRDCRTVTLETDLKPVEDMIDEFAVEKTPRPGSTETPGWQGLAAESISMNQPEFSQGYQLARLVRRNMGLDVRPIVDLSKILKRLDVVLEDARESPLFRVAVCASKGGLAHVVPSSMDNRRGPAGFRFAIASALGRLLWQSRLPGETRICAALGDYAMLSQSRRANAFAAEFLLPHEAIKGKRFDPTDVWKLSEDYGISHTAARWHVHNTGGMSKFPD
jgi:hypothetical protein